MAAPEITHSQHLLSSLSGGLRDTKMLHVRALCKNRLKIDTKIYQKIDASWDRFWGGFGIILGTEM